jgi:hypothetical protein
MWLLAYACELGCRKTRPTLGRSWRRLIERACGLDVFSAVTTIFAAKIFHQ